MPKINVYLPPPVFEAWENDPKHKGLIAKLVADYYGFTIYKSRVVKNPTRLG